MKQPLQFFVKSTNRRHGSVNKEVGIFATILKLTTKRERLIFATLVSTTFTLVTLFTPGLNQYLLATITVLLAVGLTNFALWEDLEGARYFLIPIFPASVTLMTVANGIVLPMPVPMQLLLVFVYGVVMYFVLLISNIFTIATFKAIPLKRAAHAASFLLHMVLLFALVFFFALLKLPPYVFALCCFAGTILPSLYLFWSFDLAPQLSRRDIDYSIGASVIIAQATLILGFWPLSPLIYALFATTMYYMVTGILHQNTVNRLTRRILLEYITVLVFAFIVMLLTAQWGG